MHDKEVDVEHAKRGRGKSPNQEATKRRSDEATKGENPQTPGNQGANPQSYDTGVLRAGPAFSAAGLVILLLMIAPLYWGCASSSEEVALHRVQLENAMQAAQTLGAEGTGTLQFKTQPPGLIEGITLPFDVNTIASVHLDPTKAALLESVLETQEFLKQVVAKLLELELAPEVESQVPAGAE